jgi:hypothetical protein
MTKKTAAFTLLGYMIAEMRGRKNESIEKTMGGTLFNSALRPFSQNCRRRRLKPQSSDLQHFIVTIAASIYGAVTYRLQLSATVKRSALPLI